MGYFSNGTQGGFYNEEYCFHCAHWQYDVETDTEGCPVWDAHINSDQREMAETDSLLHLLIPRGQDGQNLECAMFLSKSKLKPAKPRQKKIKPPTPAADGSDRRIDMEL
jgi:hypothetical protein